MSVKDWIASRPSVEAVRPGRCPACAAPSRTPGAALGLHGHGRRERHQWGPAVAGGPPTLRAILLRRYLCRSCGAVVAVGPRGIMRRRLYSASAIALALALFGVAARSPAEIRRRVSPHTIVGPTAAAGWTSLRRWCLAVRARRLFPAVRALPDGAKLRQVAARAATTLAASGPSTGGLAVESAAFLGSTM